MLAAAGWNGQVYIYDVRTGKKKGEWAFEEESKVRDDPGIVSGSSLHCGAGCSLSLKRETLASGRKQ